jgi:phosphoglycolate phosphatase
MVKLVIFDCDGTLADSQHMIVDTMSDVFAALGLAAPRAEATRGVIGLSLIEAVSRLVPDADRALVERIVTSYREAFAARAHEAEPLFEGAEDAVRRLGARPDILLGIATGKSQRGVRRVLDNYRLEDCFVTIQTADDAPSKPHPGMIERAMGDVGARRERTVMIGDTTYDMEMAANAGVHGLGVEWGYHPSEALSGAGACHILGHFDGLDAVLDEIWATAPGQAGSTAS